MVKQITRRDVGLAQSKVFAAAVKRNKKLIRQGCDLTAHGQGDVFGYHFPPIIFDIKDHPYIFEFTFSIHPNADQPDGRDPFVVMRCGAKTKQPSNNECERIFLISYTRGTAFVNPINLTLVDRTLDNMSFGLPNRPFNTAFLKMVETAFAVLAKTPEVREGKWDEETKKGAAFDGELITNTQDFLAVYASDFLREPISYMQRSFSRSFLLEERRIGSV